MFYSRTGPWPVIVIRPHWKQYIISPATAAAVRAAHDGAAMMMIKDITSNIK